MNQGDDALQPNSQHIQLVPPPMVIEVTALCEIDVRLAAVKK